MKIEKAIEVVRIYENNEWNKVAMKGIWQGDTGNRKTQTKGMLERRINVAIKARGMQGNVYYERELWKAATVVDNPWYLHASILIISHRLRSTNSWNKCE